MQNRLKMHHRINNIIQYNKKAINDGTRPNLMVTGRILGQTFLSSLYIQTKFLKLLKLLKAFLIYCAVMLR